MQAKKRVLFINTETAPYVADNQLSTLGKKLPEKIQSSGCEIRTFMPKWGCINERRGQLHEVIRLSGMNIIIEGTDHPLIIKVASIPVSRVQVYFIDNDDYFLRKGIIGEEDGTCYDDNGERAAFYARGVLETVKKLRWIPDVIHCQGWMAEAIPFYIRTAYQDEPCFANTKIVLSLFGHDSNATLGSHAKNSLEFREANQQLLAKYNDNFDFTEFDKLGIDYADAVIEASSDVNPELMQYAKDANKPTLAYPGEDFAASYKEFFNSLM